MTYHLPVLVRQAAGHVVVAPRGDIFFDTVPALRNALLTLAAAHEPHIVLDLSAVSLCDSSALNLMVRAARMAGERGGWLRLAAPRPRVRQALELTNLDRLLSVHTSVAGAAAHLERDRTGERAEGSAAPD